MCAASIKSDTYANWFAELFSLHNWPYHTATLNAGSSCVRRKKKKTQPLLSFVKVRHHTGHNVWIFSIPVIISLCIIVYYYTVCLFFVLHICCFVKQRRTNKQRNKSTWNKTFNKELELKSPLIIYTCLTSLTCNESTSDDSVILVSRLKNAIKQTFQFRLCIARKLQKFGNIAKDRAFNYSSINK